MIKYKPHYTNSWALVIGINAYQFASPLSYACNDADAVASVLSSKVMKLHVGTSGYSYKEWKGNFYPEDLPAKEMLAYYSRRLPAVEINNTFYRLPQPGMIENWRDQVPPEFRFSIKATQRITHIKRLKNCAEETKYLLDNAALLGERLGVVLFQLPPNSKKDSDRLKDFLSLLPGDKR